MNEKAKQYIGNLPNEMIEEIIEAESTDFSVESQRSFVYQGFRITLTVERVIDND